MISASTPEPRCDVDAQIRAMMSPWHPKRAVWLARGTAVPVLSGVERVDDPAGVLLTIDATTAQRFRDAPSDDQLAEILGYVEPKSAVTEPFVVVQAREGDCVVTEMAVSVGRISDAADVAAKHGQIVILSLPDALLRRYELCRAEAGMTV
jgi:hypothetical protein